MDESFLKETHSKHPWVPQLLIAREPVSAELIRFFLLNYKFPDGKDDGEWNWDEVIPILGIDFISQHIVDIPFELSSLTKELDESHYVLIKEHPEAAWDWNYISTQYPVGYLLENVPSLSHYLVLPIFLNRVFTDKKFAQDGALSNQLREAIECNISKLSFYYNVNDKSYLWSEEVICFFENLGLLQWEGGNYQRGFVFNQSLVWDDVFFSKYYNRLSNEDSFNYIALNLTDNTTVDKYPDFCWNWDILSRNKIVYDDYDFVSSHISNLNATIVLLNCSSSLVEDYFTLFNANSLMLDDVALRLKITNSVSVDFIRKHIHCEWDWPSVTKRVYKTINIDVMGNDAWRDKWDWNFLSEMLPLDSIMEYADSYVDKWNWMVVLRRFSAEELIRDNILSQLLRIFAEKESAEDEWAYLSVKVPVKTIYAYLDEFPYSWDWEKVLPRTSPDELLDEKMLDKIQVLIAEKDNKEQLWSIITRRFNTKQLIDVISEYSDDKFLWDVEDLYSRSDFVAKDYLDNYFNNIKWDVFSASSSVNKLFEKAKSKKTRSLWLRIFKDYLENKDYHWSFPLLSHLTNILEEPRLLQLEKDWDWVFISEYAKWINTEKGNDYFFKRFIDKFSFEKLSYRTDINLTEELIKAYDSKYNWDWNALTQNRSISYSLEFIGKYIDKPWHWDVISCRDDLTMEFINEHKNMDWDWNIVTSKPFFVPSVDFLNYIEEKDGDINWTVLSESSNLSLEVVRQFQSKIDWVVLIENNPHFFEIASDLVAFISEYEQYISWDILNKRVGNKITTNLLNTFPSKIDWRNASLSQSLDYTIDLVKKYENNWYWKSLTRNLKFKEDIPNYETIFDKKMKIVRFLEHFDHMGKKPHIYHFTHLYNAIDVIKSRKILSRERASELELLRFDSAGSVVQRSDLAHCYARFYFRPCTPTQYYSEALGADSQLGEMGYGRPIYDEFTGERYFPRVWKSKYPKALGLGLPKCPIPVFFRFDIDEVLSNMAESCYYSDRNMQSNNPCVYKILEKPDYLGVDYLYDTMSDTKRRAKASGQYDGSEIDRYMKYSQQEFLVKSEFDFSNLQSLLIICYDKKYTEILRNYFKDDPIVNKIVSYDDDNVNEHLFERENRSIRLSQQVDNYSLSCNFMDDYYYKIVSQSLSDVAFDFSCAHIIKENETELLVSGIVKWKQTCSPFDIVFVDPNARTKEWLIYSNSAHPSSDSSKFVLEEHVRNFIESFDVAMAKLPLSLSKGMFYPHMVDSYHGIAHTARVLCATHLLCNAIELSDDETKACYIAAIIHDLGKRNDREGAEHGYNSMVLYKDKIKSFIDNESLQERTLNAVCYHSVDDKDTPEDITQDIIWKVLKDADALDRSRFGGRGCDKSYLRLGIYQKDIGQNIIDLTSYLPVWSESLDWEHPYDELVKQIHKYAD